MSESYSITDLSKEFDVTTRTIRFYEERGLLKPIRKGSTTRFFSPTDRTRLKLILRGKRLGLSLDESSEIIQMYDHAGNNRKQIQALIDKVKEKRVQFKQQKKDLEQMLAELQEAEKMLFSTLKQTPKKVTA